MVTAPDIPGHRVGSVLGAGGFATVYRCWQLTVGREVAVKVDNRALLSERDRRRFFREVTAAGRLSGHPHVIDVYDAGTLGDGRPYLVMELCPAGSLNDAIRRDGPMDAERVRDIGVRLADALAAAHAAGVLHRDIKPANILVNRYGMVGLADFGLASIISVRGEQTASREALTPAFSSPETFRGEEPTVLADVYSLAATLYALLAGRPPRFPAGSRPPSLVTIMTLHDKPVDDIPGTPPALMALLRRSLSADPSVRPPGAAALRDALAAPYASVSSASVSFASAVRTGPRDFPGDPTNSRPELAALSLPSAAPPRGWLTPRRIGLAVVLIAVIAAVALTAARLLPDNTGTGSATGQTSGGPATANGPATATGQAAAGNSRSTGPPAAYGVATVSAGCPAASAGVATARCPATPECWGGLVVISGAASAESAACTQPHDWETFAIAILPAGVRTFDQPTVAADPAVTKLCTMRLLLASRQPLARRLPGRAWRIEVLPPSETAYDTGTRTYRRIANDDGNEPNTSQFRRLDAAKYVRIPPRDGLTVREDEAGFRGGSWCRPNWG